MARNEMFQQFLTVRPSEHTDILTFMEIRPMSLHVEIRQPLPVLLLFVDHYMHIWSPSHLNFLLLIGSLILKVIGMLFDMKHLWLFEFKGELLLNIWLVFIFYRFQSVCNFWVPRKFLLSFSTVINCVVDLL